MIGITELLIFVPILIGVFLIVRFVLRKKSKPSPDSAIQDGRMSTSNVPRRFHKGIRGTARDVEKREVSSKGHDKASEDYLSFRLERVDDEGNVMELIPIEIRAENIPGRIIKDGDTVIVMGRRNRQGLMIPKFIFNVTTNSEIKVKGFGFVDAILGGFLGIIVIFSALGLFVGLLLSFGEPTIGIPLLVGSILVLSICTYISRKRRL